MDDKLTMDMQGWLDTEPALRDIEAGALMVLQLNRNRHMYQLALKAPARMAPKIEYELRKFLRIRLDGLTAGQVETMEKTVVPDSLQTASLMDEKMEEDATGTARGIRPDHDRLPDDIRALWDKNRELFRKLKNVHETLKSMEDAQPCDRYEYLKVLKELDLAIRGNMKKYDGYKAGTATAENAKAEAEQPDPAALSRKIQAARTYVSENKGKLRALKESLPESMEEFRALKGKVAERADFLEKAGCPLSGDNMKEMEELFTE